MAFVLGLALFVGLAGALDAKLQWRRSRRENTAT
jgi:hypothetical protein